METTINIDDYLSEDEKKEIARITFRDELRRKFSAEYEVQRFLNNAAYNIMIEELGKEAPNYKEVIYDRIKKIFEGDSWNFEVFYRSDISKDRNSEAVKIIDAAVRNNQELIQQRVKDCIANYDMTKYINKKMYDALSELSNSSGDVATYIWNMMHHEDKID